MKLPSHRWRFAHLAALWAYGVSQPVFSMLKGNPEFLVVRGSTRADVVVFAFALAFVPPLVVLALEASVSLVSRPLSRALHIVAVWAFAYVAVLQLTRLLNLDSRVALLLPLVAAVVAVFLYGELSAFRSFLSLSFLLPVVGVVGFVATVPLVVDDAPAADVRVANPVPVVLVTFDEFPVSSIMRADGSIDALRYPNFARLAREGTWYPHATSVNEATTQAVPAILTGIEPHHGELPTLADHPDNLFTLLGRRYTLRASEQVTRLCPTRYCPQTAPQAPLVDRQRGLFYDVAVGYLHRVIPQSIAGQLPPIGERWGGFGETSDADVKARVVGALNQDAWIRLEAEAGGQAQSQFAGFLRTLRPSPGKPSLYFEHALLPHAPWRFLPSGRAYPHADLVAGVDGDWNRWRPVPWLVDTALQRHLLQVAYTDRVLGVLLRRLRALGLDDRALVIVTADHGVSFEPNGLMREVAPENLADIAGVPLFVKYPGQHRGRVDNRDARTIDIVPTIADVLGVEIPWHVDGVSLRGRPVADRPVSVTKVSGDPVSGDPAIVAAGVLSTAHRNASLFGEGKDSMYRTGPFTALLDSPVSALNVLANRSSAVRFDDGLPFDHVRLASGLIPASIAGAIRDTAVTHGTPLAIAVNGRVRATTRSFDLNGQHRFAAMVPETAFHNGRNAVEVYSVTRANGAFRLAALGGTAGDRVVAAAAVAARRQGEGGSDMTATPSSR
jgi:Sulfatase